MIVEGKIGIYIVNSLRIFQIRMKTALIVTFLLVWLAALIFFGGKLASQRTASRQDSSDLKSLQQSIEAFNTKHQCLPGAKGKHNFDIDLETDQAFVNLLGTSLDPLVDINGKFFRIRLDANKDGIVHCPTDNEPVSASFLIWSAGRDGKFETWADNAKSW